MHVATIDDADCSSCEADMATGEEWTEESGRYVMSVAVSMTGVDAYRIRRYEAAGLVKPVRTEGGQRLFSDSDIARVREVAKLEREGVNLKGISVILGMKGAEVGLPENT